MHKIFLPLFEMKGMFVRVKIKCKDNLVLLASISEG